jgi:hypothetical protein
MGSRFDEDVQGRAVGGPPRYDFGARGPVFAVPVARDGETVAYLFHGSDDEPDAAGLISRMQGDFQPAGSGHWLGVLRELRAQEVPAAQAIQSLLGATGPVPAGRVGSELRRYESKSELEALLNPERRDSTRGRGGAEPSRGAGSGVTRSAIDAALRGQTPLPPPVAERVAAIDSALAVKPTPEAVVVAMTPASAVIPDDLAPGVRVFEPSFLTTYLAGADERFPNQPIVVRLRVPAGIPALFQEAALPGSPGTLLLGRGVEWEVDRIVQLPGQTIVTAHVTARRPGEI